MRDYPTLDFDTNESKGTAYSKKGDNLINHAATKKGGEKVRRANFN